MSDREGPSRADDYGDALRRLRTRAVDRSAPAEAEAVTSVHGALADARADERGMPADAARVDDLLDALAVLRLVREDIAEWEPLLITAARAHGVSWARLAPALGVTSRQAAERRYLRLQPSATGEATGEARVRAERTRRAGDRAVAGWARQNAASLRQLAGQVSALTDLAPPARAQADAVERALADDDPAALLSPLADARSHLPARHAALAERIRTMTEHTERVRRDTEDRRAEDRQPASRPAEAPDGGAARRAGPE